MTQTLLSIFPKPNDLLALEPEELGGVILELAPDVSQNAGFTIQAFRDQLFKPTGDGYPSQIMSPVIRTIAEALSWLVSQGLIIHNPEQHANFYIPTSSLSERSVY